MKNGKKPCGCYISNIGHMPANITFCEFHASAPQLKQDRADLLKLAHLGEDLLTIPVIRDLEDRAPTNCNPVADYRKLARALIARMEG